MELLGKFFVAMVMILFVSACGMFGLFAADRAKRHFKTKVVPFLIFVGCLLGGACVVQVFGLLFLWGK
jgi:hypothetical protein